MEEHARGEISSQIKLANQIGPLQPIGLMGMRSGSKKKRNKDERAKRKHKFLWEAKVQNDFPYCIFYEKEDKVMMWHYDMVVLLIQGIAHCAFILNNLPLKGQCAFKETC